MWSMEGKTMTRMSEVEKYKLMLFMTIETMIDFRRAKELYKFGE